MTIPGHADELKFGGDFPRWARPLETQKVQFEMFNFSVGQTNLRSTGGRSPGEAKRFWRSRRAVGVSSASFATLLAAPRWSGPGSGAVEFSPRAAYAIRAGLALSGGWPGGELARGELQAKSRPSFWACHRRARVPGAGKGPASSGRGLGD